MATISLEEIQSDAQERYGDLVIDTGDDALVLRNALRLSKEARAELFSLFDKRDENEDAAAEDIEDVFDDVLRLVASKAHAAKLLKYDAPTKAVIFERYTQATQAGEASSSEN